MSPVCCRLIALRRSSPRRNFHHHERVMALVLAKIVNAQNVFVGDVARGAGLSQEPRLYIRVFAPLVGENLDGHSPADHGVARTIDVRHAAAEVFLQLVFSDVRGKLDSRHCSNKNSRSGCGPTIWPHNQGGYNKIS
jgi:hypothetical protein